MTQESFFIEDEQLPNEKDFSEFIRKYQQMCMLYESALKFVTSRLDILKKENEANGSHIAIREVQNRIKTIDSINEKLRRISAPLSIHSIWENLNDVSGIRVICEYVSDVYYVRNVLPEENHVELLQEKDYIANPNPNGYRSLHLIVNVPVLLQEGKLTKS